jgi:signal transduction histidine kinase/ActR/RegA family two-component response regulator
MGSMRSTPAFLREQQDRILREWEANVQAEAPIVDLTGSVLRNHIPEFLDELANWLEGTAPPGTAAMRLAAVAHAGQRLEHGFQLTQLLHELRLLRATILRLLLDTEALAIADRAATAERVIALARLNTGLDCAVADVVDHFTTERERRLTELANREIQQARESDARKTAFLAVLSHELRNPLAPILNSLHILERAKPGSEQSLRAREVIHRQTRHLTRLVDDLLDLTRISHGKIELHRERFDLREVVRATCDDHRSLVEERALVLRLESAGPVWIDGDPTRVAQILSNLLQNAAKFTPAGGTVTVSIAVKDRCVALHVRDNGIGMAPAVIERIFEPFEQASQQIAMQQGGLGLGLALAQGLAELHGGSISAQSRGPGHGSEFVVELPLALPSVAEAETVAASAPSPSRLVLIIEDNVDHGETLAQVLALSGHRARVARTGKSGIALAQDLKPDVVLCDIGLPDMDGYEVARALRTNGDLATTRLIAVSGFAQPEDKKRAKEAGFDAHLAKPPPLDELNAMLADPSAAPELR